MHEFEIFPSGCTIKIQYGGAVGDGGTVGEDALVKKIIKKKNLQELKIFSRGCIMKK